MNKEEKKGFYNNFLNEKLGINNDVIILSNFIYDIIFEQVLIFSKDLEDKNIHNKTTLILDNNELVNAASYSFPIEEMNNRLNNLSLKILKLKDFIFDLDITFISEDMFDLELFNASFDDLNLKLNNDVFYNGKLYFDLYIPSTYLKISKKNENTLNIFLNNFKIDKDILSMLNHEFTHALEFTQKFKKGKNISEERLLNFLVYLLKKEQIVEIAPLWGFFLNLIYLQLSYEVNARVSQLGALIDNKTFNTQNEFWTEVKQTTVWKEMVDMNDFDPQTFYDNFEYDAKDEDIDELFNYSGTPKDKLLKHLIHMFDEKINIVNDYFEQHGDIEMKKLSKKVLNDPMEFLDFWDKRFKIVFEKFRRKIARLYTTELNERKKEKEKTIWWIIKQSDTPIEDLKEYIKNGGNVNTRHNQYDKLTPLMYCIKYSRITELIELLIPVSKLNMQDINGQTALFITLQRKKLDIFKLIIKTNNVKLNVKVNGDDEYLSFAIAHNSYTYVWLLLTHLTSKEISFEHIYDLLYKDKYTLAELAIDKVDISELTKTTDENETLFHVCNDNDIFIKLIEKGVDMTVISTEGSDFLYNMNENDISYIANNIKDKNSVEYKYFNKIVKQKKFNL
jgi:hypothetical protein